MSKLIIIGAGGHGRVVADIAKITSKYQEIFFLDDGVSGKNNGYEIIGKVSDYKKYIGDSDFFVGIGNNALRKKICENIISDGGSLKSFIHPNAVVADGVKIGKGVVIVAGAVVNVASKIGDGVIINTAASVDHDCVVGEYVHISVGAHLCGMVNVGECTNIGAGATVIQCLNICPNAIIGAGAVVIRDITEKGTFIGVPALEKGELHKPK